MSTTFWQKRSVIMLGRTGPRGACGHVTYTVQWIRDAYFASEGRCTHCKCVMSYMLGCRKQVTVDRIQDDIAHIMSNCVLACLDCNRAHENLKHLNVD